MALRGQLLCRHLDLQDEWCKRKVKLWCLRRVLGSFLRGLEGSLRGTGESVWWKPFRAGPHD
eukprot:3604374-Karenia_brevis.AAC.1